MKYERWRDGSVEDTISTGTVNLDTVAAVTFVAEGSPVRHQLRAFVQGQQLIMTATARDEFETTLNQAAGPLERARAQRLLARVTLVPDHPSARAAGLRPTLNLEAEDIIIFGTGDRLGAPTLTGDRRAVRAARAQGVIFDVILHDPFPLRGV